MSVFKTLGKRLKTTLFIYILLIGIFLPLLALVQLTSGEIPWWNNNWNFRKAITLNHTMVNSTSQNFPVLIDITDSDLKKAQLGGNDIVFVDSNNTKLNHEIEFFDSTSGHLVAWVNVPLLSSTEDTLLEMYYGNPTALNQQNSSAVWDSNFTVVQHLEETGVKRFDSTSYGNNGTTYGGIVKSAAGRIDGADVFDGINDYMEIANSPSLNPSSAITIALWMNLSLTGNYINLVSKGTYNQYYLRLGPSRGYTYWYVKFSDGTSKSVEGTAGWTDNEWHYIVATIDTKAQTVTIYVDAVARLNGTFTAGKSIIATTSALRVSDTIRQTKGSIDEFRISNISRSPSWIQTTYNNQKSPSEFCSAGPEETSLEADPILVSVESPPDGATEVYTNPTLSIRALELDGRPMNISIRGKVSNIWTEIASFLMVNDGIYTAIPTDMKNLGTIYYWNVYVTNGQNSVNKTFSFTTTTKILQQKWMIPGVPRGVSGVLAADVNGDDIDEIIHAGKSGVIVLKGTDGSVIWNFSDVNIGDHAQAQVADLNKDGIPEIVVPLESPGGLLALRGNNGGVYWRTTGLGGNIYSSPVIFDIDGNGYPTIFVGSTDISNGLKGTGRLSAVSYNGTILSQTFTWRPCSGGLSIADADGDGEFELYMGDRYMYLNSPEYSDNDYGKGVQSYWARNLTLRWSRPEIFCSSQIPMLADINNDGKLEVIIGDLNGGLAVLNATDGSTIHMTLGISNDAPTHYQPAIYDIDRDGNLEMLMADPHDTTSDDLVIWDLVNWKVDARIYIGKNFYGPQLADVTGDGIMEIIVCNYRSIFIIDKSYRVIDGIVGLSGEISQGNETRNIDGISMLAGTLNYAVVQDIDGDGYNELVVSTQSGAIYAFDTPARRPNPRPRSGVQFYSEYRLGAAEYVQPQGGPTPMILSPNPPNLAKNVPISLSKLEFTLTDYQHDLMNYTVTTSPNIGSDSKINVGNGRYTLNVSDLTSSTTYTWVINVTDGTHPANKTFTFTTGSVGPWWNSDWEYRKTITIDHNKVNNDLQDFPVLIEVFDSDLTNKAQLNGSDIVFIDMNGTKLNHEIESYDNTTGHLVAWVKIPNLSSTTDTSIYIYYGNAQAPNQQNPSAVWAYSFAMVQHLKEASAIRYDSTTNHNDGTAYGGISKSSVGKINGADSLDGVDDYIQVPNSQTLNPSSAITVELWMNLSLTGNYINVVSKGSYSQYYLRLGPQAGYTYWYIRFSDGTSQYIEGNIGWVPNTWHYLVATVDTQTQTIKIYLDGITKLSGSFAAGKTIVSTVNSLTIGDISTRRIKGAIDEIRVSNVARSAEWIQTSYNNQKALSSFYTFKSEETIPEGPIVFTPIPPDESTNVSPSLSQLSFNLTDSQGQMMNYTVATFPDIGSGSDENISDGRITIPISGLQYFTTYTWVVSVTDGTHWTNVTYTFTTVPSELPTQTDPILVLDAGGNPTCYNQTTYDSEGERVTNIYNWYKDNTSITNVLLPFETNSSTAAKDYSGYNNNGIIIGGVTWTQNGIVGGAYNFDRGFIQIPGSDILDGGGQWSEITVEEWIYLTAFQSGTRSIARIPSYEIGISGNKIFASIWTATGNAVISGLNQIVYNTTLQTNTWYHIVLTYKKGVAMTLYVNGSAVATKTLLDSITLNYNIQPSGSNPLYIGWFDYFKGKIDEVRIYSRSLSPQQIYQRYIETKDGLSNSSKIVVQETKIGETWKCEVTPNDSHIDGTTKTSNTITIGQNNKPSAENLTITPLTPRTNDDLIASYTYFDPDGDPENTTQTQIRWYKNSTLQTELNNTLTVPYYLTAKGETWHFTVEPSDGKEFGSIYESPHVLVQNSPPTIDSITPEELTLEINETETIQFAHISSDPDNDTLAYSWLLNGTEQSTAQNWTYTSDYNSAGTHNITLIVSDGDLIASQQWNVTVNDINEPPTIDSHYPLTDPTINEGESQEFNITYSDPNGDIITVQWYLNDTPTVSTDFYLFEANYTSAGTYNVTVTISDGSFEVPYQWNLTVLNINQPPEITSYYPPTNSSDPIYIGDSQEFNITCYDPDGDGLTIQWYIDDTLQEGWTGNTSVIFQPTQAGNHIITVAVSDWQDEIQNSWAISVEQSPP